jgi:hypothetical protein
VGLSAMEVLFLLYMGGNHRYLKTNQVRVHWIWFASAISSTLRGYLF